MIFIFRHAGSALSYDAAHTGMSEWEMQSRKRRGWFGFHVGSDCVAVSGSCGVDYESMGAALPFCHFVRRLCRIRKGVVPGRKAQMASPP